MNMNCMHDWRSPGSRLSVAFTIDNWQGPTSFIARCAGCGQYALLRLLQWQGARLEDRIFSVAPLPEAAVSVFLKDMNTGYCDLSRHAAEVNALTATADPVSQVVGIRSPDLKVSGCRLANEGEVFKHRNWQELSTTIDDTYLSLIAT